MKKLSVIGIALRKVVLAVALVALPVFSFAQTQTTVKGTVLSKTTGESVIGAGITIKGTTKGVTTDLDGKYSIQCSPKDILVFSSVGYKSQETPVGNRAVIDFLAEDDVSALDEAVVVGYGTLKKRSVVGAVENISGEKVENRTNSYVARSLQGQVPGLNIVQVDGKPNHQGSIYVRGAQTSFYSKRSATSSSVSEQTLGQGGGALVLIDGAEGDLSTVNPADIATVAVLKDASSAAVYGARGVFGVILVTTKTPQKGSVKVNYNGSVSVNRRTVIWEDGIVDDPAVWVDNFETAYLNITRTPTSTGDFPATVNNYIKNYSSTYSAELKAREAAGNLGTVDVDNSGKYLYYGHTNWLSMFFKPYNTTQQHNLTVQGANDRVSYYVSGRYYTTDGIYKVGNETFNQYNMRSKGTIKIRPWLTLDNNMSALRRNYRQPMMSTGGNIMRQCEHQGYPFTMVYNPDGTYTAAAVATGYYQFSEGTQWMENDKTDFQNTTTLTAVPIKDVLKISGDFTYKSIRSKRNRLVGTNAPYSSAQGVSANYTATTWFDNNRYDTDYESANVVVTWTPKLGEKHDLNVVAGWNLENEVYRNQYVYHTGVLDYKKPSFTLMDGEDWTTTSGGYTWGFIGAFGRINYNFDKRYLVELSARYDGSSKFPSDQLWGFFPSGSAGWIVSSEPWMEWSKGWLDNFKIRVSAGSLGNAAISPYQFLETMSVSKTSILLDGNKTQYVSTPSPIPDSLTWETATTYDIGLDIDMFNNRLNFVGDLYQRDTKNMYTVGPNIPQVYGSAAPKGNYASMSTKGWELSLGWRDGFELGGKPFSYSFKAMLWDSRSFITDYYNTTGDITTYYKGMELGDIWGFKTAGIFKDNEEANNWADESWFKNGSNFKAYAGDLKFIDLDGDNKISVGNRTLSNHGDLAIIGNMLPRYQFGFNFAFSWNNIGISGLIQGVGKRSFYPWTDSGFFWGKYNRPYSYVLKSQIGDNVAQVDYSNENWVVTNYDKNPYWSRLVAYAANRVQGPLTWENDHYLQNVAYARLKNVQIDYTFPKELVSKIGLQALKVYLSGENLLTFSPLFKHTQMFDPEVIGNGDEDFSDTPGLGSSAGSGYSYPMLKTVTLGIDLTF